MKKGAISGISGALATAASVALLATLALAQTEKILHTFTGSSDGGAPEAGLIFDSKGNLYGATSGGGVGTFCSGCGTVFELNPGPDGTWTETVLYSFGSSSSDGNGPYSALVFDTSGNLYGTTFFGGSGGQGTVFELTPGSGGTWTEKVLYTFTGGSDGGFLYGNGVTLDGSGTLYGMTEAGGKYGFGVVFELLAGPNGTWTQKVLHHFSGGSDGAYPLGAGLVMDAAGNLYGTTSAAGAHDYGMVFELTKGAGGNWTEKVIHAFPGGSAGSSPSGTLVFDTSGNLYGVATFSVFELMPNSNGTWTEKTLHSFTGGSDGAGVYGNLVFDKAGNLYGMTNTGGMHRGTVFELSPGPNGTWTEKILHSFSPSGGDGIFPNFAGLVVDASGNVYGTTPLGGSFNNGVIFEITP